MTLQNIGLLEIQILVNTDPNMHLASGNQLQKVFTDLQVIDQTIRLW